MKTKFFFLLALLVAGVCPLAAQTHDTISGEWGRVPGYHYKNWYDQCPQFTAPDDNQYLMSNSCIGHVQHVFGGGSGQAFGTLDSVLEPSAITGVGIMWADATVCPGSYPRYYTYEIKPKPDPRVPEYVAIYSFDFEREELTLLLDSVRWDTAAPKVLKLPRHHDTATYGFTHVYFSEVRLPEPVIVDSLFYIVYTSNNSEVTDNWWPYYKHVPMFVAYYSLDLLSIQHYDSLTGNYYHDRCPWVDIPRPRRYDRLTLTNNSSRAHFYTFPDYMFGGIMPKIDSANLDVRPADSTMGTAWPSGLHSMHINYLVQARPKLGYRFTHWSDGSTMNPRHILLESDTTLTAYFTSAEQFEVIVNANNQHGTVGGGGNYYVGDTATITAEAVTPGYKFLFWDDRDTTNPRSFAVTQDSIFTAYFVKSLGISGPDDDGLLFALAPNPASTEVTVFLDNQTAGPSATILLRDATGRLLSSCPAAGPATTVSTDGLAAGIYFVTVVSPQATATRRLIIE